MLDEKKKNVGRKMLKCFTFLPTKQCGGRGIQLLLPFLFLWMEWIPGDVDREEADDDERDDAQDGIRVEL